MNVRFQLWGQLRQAAGADAPEVELPQGGTASQAVQALAGRLEGLRPLLLDDAGVVRPVILVFRDGRQLEPDDPQPLPDGCELTLMSPIAGG